MEQVNGNNVINTWFKLGCRMTEFWSSYDIYGIMMKTIHCQVKSQWLNTIFATTTKLLSVVKCCQNYPVSSV